MKQPPICRKGLDMALSDLLNSSRSLSTCTGRGQNLILALEEQGFSALRGRDVIDMNGVSELFLKRGQYAELSRREVEGKPKGFLLAKLVGELVDLLEEGDELQFNRYQGDTNYPGLYISVGATFSEIAEFRSAKKNDAAPANNAPKQVF